MPDPRRLGLRRPPDRRADGLQVGATIGEQDQHRRVAGLAARASQLEGASVDAADDASLRGGGDSGQLFPLYNEAAIQPPYRATVMTTPIQIPSLQLTDFCRRHHIRRLGLFGSVLRPDFGPQSDVDVLVEFAPGHTPGLAFFAMQDELSAILGRTVDLNTPAWLGPELSKRVERNLEVVYAAA